MGYFFFDDSKHRHPASFSIGAFVYCREDPAPRIETAIRDVGLTPYSDEFKSGYSMQRHPEQRQLRDRLAELDMDTRIAAVVCPGEWWVHPGHLLLPCRRSYRLTRHFVTRLLSEEGILSPPSRTRPQPLAPPARAAAAP